MFKSLFVRQGTPEMWDAINGQVFAADTVSRTIDIDDGRSKFRTVPVACYCFFKTYGSCRCNEAWRNGILEIDLGSDWRVSFGTGASTMMDRLHSWADDEATRYFSGTATYEDSSLFQHFLARSGKHFRAGFRRGHAVASDADHKRHADLV